MNCYSAYLKAELANRKTNKVGLRDLLLSVHLTLMLSAQSVTAFATVKYGYCMRRD